jgi:hypothetical protein
MLALLAAGQVPGVETPADRLPEASKQWIAELDNQASARDRCLIRCVSGRGSR